MTLKQPYSIGLYESLGWRSHEANRIMRQGRNFLVHGKTEKDAFDWMQAQWAKVDEECREIMSTWDQIEALVRTGTVEAFIAQKTAWKRENLKRMGLTEWRDSMVSDVEREQWRDDFARYQAFVKGETR
jgi:hypothetical protein